MTRREAIEMLNNRDSFSVPTGYTGGWQEVVDIAVKSMVTLKNLKEQIKSWRI